MDLKEFGKRLFTARKAVGLTQNELAARARAAGLECVFQYIGLLENATPHEKNGLPRQPSRALVKFFARELKQPEQEFLDLAGYESDVRVLRIIGPIAAGEPSEAMEGDFGEVSVAESWLASVPNAKALRVVGHSMKGSRILNDDIVIVGDSSVLQNRIVAAYVITDDGGTYKATLKVWKQKGRTIELRPSNPEYKMYVFNSKSKARLEAFGVVFKVLRSYDYSKRDIIEVINEDAEMPVV